MNKIIFILTLSAFLFSQQGEITNVTASQRTDGSKLVDIYYDLSEDALTSSFNITVEVSFDGGLTYLPMLTVSGDIGENIVADQGLYILWDLGNDYDNSFSSNTIIKINAQTHLVFGDNPFDMIEVPAGEYTNCNPWHPAPDLDYDFEIMKYLVTNAQFAEFLINATAEGVIQVDQNGKATSYYPGDQYNDAGTFEVYCRSCDCMWLNGGECPNCGIISWNGSTFIVDEGYGNHPLPNALWFGAWKFADYYGLRLPSVYEVWKTAFGNTTTNFAWGGDALDPQRHNYLNSGDPWECGTTPVDFYNGQNYEGFQTIDSPSYYGAYMNGNVREYTASNRADVEECEQGGNDDGFCGQKVRLGKPFNQNNNNDDGLCYDAPTWFDTGGVGSGFRCAKTIGN